MDDRLVGNINYNEIEGAGEGRIYNKLDIA